MVDFATLSPPEMALGFMLTVHLAGQRAPRGPFLSSPVPRRLAR
ncbi:hypothetical protein N177_0995 [Lutibaculum baratangense AMV1]|uniref:Uncharacterized protein n=1 Tax=Lutibaculum baratangense AMV1 TaxID=631454 RepID=V4RJ70_9HYPH|nr:hypothetical protein N177_0995 [Lutibaculum baratangense AMV1]